MKDRPRWKSRWNERDQDMARLAVERCALPGIDGPTFFGCVPAVRGQSRDICFAVPATIEEFPPLAGLPTLPRGFCRAVFELSSGLWVADVDRRGYARVLEIEA